MPGMLRCTWNGDCADFQHIWINEGFATWSEAYWREQSEGIAAYHAEMNDARFLGAGTIFVEDPNNFNEIFNYFLSYQKASWVPHMLRHVVGEMNFQAALLRMRADHGFADATTQDVQLAFEAESGLDLTDFFQQWIYAEYYPAYSLSWTANEAGGLSRVMVRVAQTQTNTGLFNMPLDVLVKTAAGDSTTFVVQNSQTEQWYSFEVTGTVAEVVLDPDDWVLCTVAYDGVSDVPSETLSAALELRDCVPNPFNPLTTIRFHLAAPTEVRLDIHDVAGRLVKNLVAGSFTTGDHQVRWDGTDDGGRSVASGTYFARLQGAGLQQVRSLTLVR